MSKWRSTTQAGYPVRVYATDGVGDYPIHGAIDQGGGWTPISWRVDGRYWNGDTSNLDLVPLLPTKIPVWVVVNQDGNYIFSEQEPNDTDKDSVVLTGTVVID